MSARVLKSVTTAALAALLVAGVAVPAQADEVVEESPEVVVEVVEELEAAPEAAPEAQPEPEASFGPMAFPPAPVGQSFTRPPRGAFEMTGAEIVDAAGADPLACKAVPEYAELDGLEIEFIDPDPEGGDWSAATVSFDPEPFSAIEALFILECDGYETDYAGGWFTVTAEGRGYRAGELGSVAVIATHPLMTQALSFTAIDWALGVQTERDYELAGPTARIPGPVVTFGANGPGWAVEPGPEFAVDLTVTLLDGTPSTVRLHVASVGELPTGTPPTGTAADWVWTAPVAAIADPDLDRVEFGQFDMTGYDGRLGCMTTPLQPGAAGEPMPRSRTAESYPTAPARLGELRPMATLDPVYSFPVGERVSSFDVGSAVAGNVIVTSVVPTDPTSPLSVDVDNLCPAGVAGGHRVTDAVSTFAEASTGVETTPGTWITQDPGPHQGERVFDIWCGTNTPLVIPGYTITPGPGATVTWQLTGPLPEVEEELTCRSQSGMFFVLLENGEQALAMFDVIFTIPATGDEEAPLPPAPASPTEDAPAIRFETGIDATPPAARTVVEPQRDALDATPLLALAALLAALGFTLRRRRSAIEVRR